MTHHSASLTRHIRFEKLNGRQEQRGKENERGIDKINARLVFKQRGGGEAEGDVVIARIFYCYFFFNPTWSTHSS